MKITRLDAWTVAIPFRNPIQSAYGVSYPARLRTIVRLTTDDGYAGIGETGPSAVHRVAGETLAADLIRRFRSTVEGRDPFQAEDILRELDYSPDAVAIEMACLDICGKVTGRSVCEFVGGVPLPQSVEIAGYSFLRLPDRDGKGAVTIENWVDSMIAQIDRHGFKTMKLKLGVVPPDLEVEVVRELRSRLPRIAIRVDPNGAWSVGTALNTMRKLEELDLEYVEDPTKDSALGYAQEVLTGRSIDIAGMRRLRTAARVPLCADNCYRLDQLRSVIRGDAADVVLGDIFGSGGLRRSLRWYQTAQTFHLGTGMHSGTEIGIGQVAKLHVAASLGGLDYAMDAIYPEYVDDVLAGGLLDIRDGQMQMPRAPGLGVEIDEERLDRWQLTASFHQELDAWWEELKREAGAARRDSSLLVRTF